MSLPSFRPDSVINALNRAFKGRSVWPKANSDPERHYQKMAVMFHYVHETHIGYVFTLARDQHVHHGGVAASANRCRMVK
jgi:hypothetical protein